MALHTGGMTTSEAAWPPEQLLLAALAYYDGEGYALEALGEDHAVLSRGLEIVRIRVEGDTLWLRVQAPALALALQTPVPESEPRRSWRRWLFLPVTISAAVVLPAAVTVGPAIRDGTAVQPAGAR